MYDISQLPEKLQERYNMLPEEITELFEYGTVDQIIDECVKEFGLRDFQESMLHMEVTLVLFFFFTRTGLSERLQDSLEIEEIRANLIAQKLNDDLFIIVDGLLTFVEEQFSREGGDEPSIAITPAPLTTEPASEAAPSTVSGVPKDSNLTKSATSLNTAPTKDTGLKPLRTYAMDVDMSRIHGYGAFRADEEKDETDTTVHRSSQDDVLDGRK